MEFAVIDDAEFRELEAFVGHSLDCSNCECCYYVDYSKCNRLYKLTNHRNCDNVSYIEFTNPYGCTEFWHSSRLARDFIEAKALRIYHCANKTGSCEEGEFWSKCRFCSNFKDSKEGGKVAYEN